MYRMACNTLPPSLPTSSHLSERLQGLRQHRSSSSPPSVSPPGGQELSPEQQLKARTTFLQSRVQHLQQHNTQLQSCIDQLRVVATMVTAVVSTVFVCLYSAFHLPTLRYKCIHTGGVTHDTRSLSEHTFRNCWISSTR